MRVLTNHRFGRPVARKKVEADGLACPACTHRVSRVIDVRANVSTKSGDTLAQSSLKAVRLPSTSFERL